MSAKLKNILVTGGLGFIGRELVRQLSHHPSVNKIVIVDNNSKHEIEDSLSKKAHLLDLTNEEDVGEYYDLLNRHKIDLVYGLAALIGGIKYFHDHPCDILSYNNIITDNTLRGIRFADKRPKFVYMSSSMVFESATKFPTEESHLEECPIPKSAYGFSKLVGEFLCQAYHDQYGIDYTIVRAFNAWGCNEYPKEVGIAHVIPDLIKKILDGQGTEDNPLQILGDGEQVRCYTHVTDICNGIIAASKNYLNPSSASLAYVGDYKDFNISIDQPHTVNQLAQLIWSKIHGDKPLYRKYLPALTYDVQKRIPSVYRARAALGWEAQIELEDTIQEVIDWVKSVN